MRFKIRGPFWQAVSLGVIAGMRSASAPAIASHILSHHQSKTFSRSYLGFMQSKKFAVALKVMAIGEFIGDKLPNTPNRTEPLGVAIRCVSGSLAGASIFKATGNNAFTGALIGSVFALGATYGCFILRRDAVAKLNIVDPIIGAIEDALVLGAGLELIRNA